MKKSKKLNLNKLTISKFKSTNEILGGTLITSHTTGPTGQCTIIPLDDVTHNLKHKVPSVKCR